MADNQMGFTFHHAEGNNAVMVQWLGTTENKIPPYAYHNFGVAGIVINSENELLVVTEKRAGKATSKKWRIPGGALDRGETIEECAMREILEGRNG
jgi:hypothetical protein